MLRHRWKPLSELGRTAALIGELSPMLIRHVVTAIIGGIGGPLLTVVAARAGATAAAHVLAVVTLLGIVASALIERHLMFTASAAPRMPGVPR